MTRFNDDETQVNFHKPLFLFLDFGQFYFKRPARGTRKTRVFKTFHIPSISSPDAVLGAGRLPVLLRDPWPGPSGHPDHVQEEFPPATDLCANTNVTAEYTNLLQNVYESIAALLGVPQLRIVNLLQERCSYWDTDLFQRQRVHRRITSSICSPTMEAWMPTTSWSTSIRSPTIPRSAPSRLIRNILDRFSTTADGKLNLDGFIQYHLDQATYNPKNVWGVSAISLIVSSPLMMMMMMMMMMVMMIFVMFLIRLPDDSELQWRKILVRYLSMIIVLPSSSSHVYLRKW